MEKIKTPLSAMLGSGSIFEAQSKKYTILPFKLKEVEEFSNDGLIVSEEGQFFNISNESRKTSLNKWLMRKVLTESGEPLSVDKAMDDDWDLDDLKTCIRTLIKISG